MAHDLYQRETICGKTYTENEAKVGKVFKQEKKTRLGHSK